MTWVRICWPLHFSVQNNVNKQYRGQDWPIFKIELRTLQWLKSLTSGLAALSCKPVLASFWISRPRIDLDEAEPGWNVSDDAGLVTNFDDVISIFGLEENRDQTFHIFDPRNQNLCRHWNDSSWSFRKTQKNLFLDPFSQNFSNVFTSSKTWTFFNKNVTKLRRFEITKAGY